MAVPIPDPEQSLSSDLEKETVRYMKFAATRKGGNILELTLNDIYEGLKRSRPKSQVRDTLALLSHQNGVLRKRMKGSTPYYSLQVIFDFIEGVWGS